MLDTIGIDSISELFEDIPENVRFKGVQNSIRPTHHISLKFPKGSCRQSSNSRPSFPN